LDPAEGRYGLSGGKPHYGEATFSPSKLDTSIFCISGPETVKIVPKISKPENRLQWPVFTDLVGWHIVSLRSKFVSDTKEKQLTRNVIQEHLTIPEDCLMTLARVDHPFAVYS
jgi:hypothetical protein